MKRMVWMTTAAMAAALAVAQGPEAAPVAAGANVGAPAIGAPAVRAAPTQVDTAKQQEVIREWQKVQMEVMTFRTNLVATDPDLKALSAKRDELVKQVNDLGKELREKVDAKLKADPVAGPLLVKLDEAQAKLREIYPMMGGVGQRGPGGSWGTRPEGVKPMPMPARIPAPAPAPDAVTK